MLNLIGDILNWSAAGVFFPLLFLPLALLMRPGGKPLVSWVLLVTVIVIAGVLFAQLTPILNLTPAPSQAGTFVGLLAATAFLVSVSGGVSTAISRLAAFFEAAVQFSGRAVMWLLLSMALVQFGVVVLRYVFGVNYIFMQESITYMHGAVFLIASGYALLTNDHVRVDIFYGQVSEKRKAVIDLAGTYGFLFPVCLLLMWSGSVYVGNSWAVGEGSTETSGIQAVFLIKSLIPAFAILLTMAGFVIASRAVATLRGRS